jgi:hypothetical protein
MADDTPYQTQAEECLEKAKAAKEADKWGWLMLAESFFRLSDFRRQVKDELGGAENRVSEYAPKSRANGAAISIITKFRELFWLSDQNFAAQSAMCRSCVGIVGGGYTASAFSNATLVAF